MAPGTPGGLSTDQQAHWAKANAYHWSPYQETLMIDADTRVKGDLSIGFKMLRHGWEVVMVPSRPPPEVGGVLWSLSAEDRSECFKQMGTLEHVMLNTGLIFFKKTPRVKALFDEWSIEWLEFKDRDQGAFLRALYRRPVFIFLLGRAYNSLGGEVVEHIFGSAR